MTTLFAPSKARHPRVSAQANVSVANVKPRSGGRNQNPRMIEAKRQGYLV